MKREILNQLIAWKDKPQRKPLVLKGARQVGKTYVLEEFGKICFQEKGGTVHYIDLKEEKKLHSAFKETSNPLEILRVIEFKSQKKINPATDLLILDEIQECPGAITSLKYFEKRLKNLAVIAAGSHLGLIKNEESFPVGKVNFLHMFPMTFGEFILAFDAALYQQFIQFSITENQKPLPTYIHEHFLKTLQYYFFTGGLPEVVYAFIQTIKDDEQTALKNVREIQLELIQSYQADFSKYSGAVNANHIHHVFNSIPMQLAQTYQEQVRKYQFSGVIPKQKGFERIQGPLNWLVGSRLCIKCFIASRAQIPLLGYCKENMFKIYFFDIGLLNAMLNTPAGAILNNQLGSYKGFIAENFVAQEFYSKLNTELFCWQEGNAEIEFIFLQEDQLAPVEVKSSSRSRRAKSLESYINRYHPPRAYKVSNQNFSFPFKTNLIKLPLYFCSKISK